MWDDAGIVRNADSLARAEAALAGLHAEHQGYALRSAGRDRGFNLAWHDWLNLGSLIAVSRAIVCAARARENSRGAHFRDDYPDPGDLARSTYTRVRMQQGTLACDQAPVRFTRVSPGQTLVLG
jgi:fumarate reductase flavoprotein subunit